MLIGFEMSNIISNIIICILMSFIIILSIKGTIYFISLFRYANRLEKEDCVTEENAIVLYEGHECRIINIDGILFFKKDTGLIINVEVENPDDPVSSFKKFLSSYNFYCLPHVRLALLISIDFLEDYNRKKYLSCKTCHNLRPIGNIIFHESDDGLVLCASFENGIDPSECIKNFSLSHMYIRHDEYLQKVFLLMFKYLYKKERGIKNDEDIL